MCGAVIPTQVTALVNLCASNPSEPPLGSTLPLVEHLERGERRDVGRVPPAPSPARSPAPSPARSQMAAKLAASPPPGNEERRPAGRRPSALHAAWFFFHVLQRVHTAEIPTGLNPAMQESLRRLLSCAVTVGSDSQQRSNISPTLSSAAC